MRARADIRTIATEITDTLCWLRERVDRSNPEVDARWAHLETFCAVSLRVLAKTNPSKIRDAALTEEIKARVNGTPVVEEQR